MRIALLLVLFLAACGEAEAPTPDNGAQAAPAPSAFVGSVVIRLNALPDRPAAGYFTLRALEPGLKLVGVTSPSAARVELHETLEANGMTSMAPLDPATLDLGQPVTFAPGGKHIMLFGVENLRAGQDAALLFTFRRPDGSTLQVPATGTVQVAGGDDMGQMGH